MFMYKQNIIELRKYDVMNIKHNVLFAVMQMNQQSSTHAPNPSFAQDRPINITNPTWKFVKSPKEYPDRIFAHI